MHIPAMSRQYCEFCSGQDCQNQGAASCIPGNIVRTDKLYGLSGGPVFLRFHLFFFVTSKNLTRILLRIFLIRKRIDEMCTIRLRWQPFFQQDTLPVSVNSPELRIGPGITCLRIRF